MEKMYKHSQQAPRWVISNDRLPPVLVFAMAARRALSSASRNLPKASAASPSVAELGRRAALLNGQSLLLSQQKRQASSDEGPTQVCFLVAPLLFCEAYCPRR